MLDSAIITPLMKYAPGVGLFAAGLLVFPLVNKVSNGAGFVSRREFNANDRRIGGNIKRLDAQQKDTTVKLHHIDKNVSKICQHLGISEEV